MFTDLSDLIVELTIDIIPVFEFLFPMFNQVRYLPRFFSMLFISVFSNWQFLQFKKVVGYAAHTDFVFHQKSDQLFAVH